MTTLLKEITEHETAGSIDDLVYPVSNTYNFSNKKEVVFINTGDVHEGKFLHNDYSPVTKLPGQAKKIIEQGDILFSEIRPKNRHFALVDFDSKDYVVSTKLIVLKVKDGVDPRFAYIVLTADKNLREFQNIAESRSGTFPQITFDSIAGFEVKLPDLQTQKKIAGILSAYDAKIENNNLVIKKLEAAAQTLFNEWFVSFRFPGYEKAKFVDSEIGEIPEGWEVSVLNDVADIVMGQSPTSNHYNGEKSGLPFHQGVTYFSDRYPDDVIYSTGGEKIAEENDILISVRAPVGRINIANTKTIIGRGLCSLRSKNGKQSFLLCLLKNLFHKEDLFGGGSVFPSITKSELEKLQVISPSIDTVNSFEKNVSSIDLEIKKLIQENLSLKSQRDQLLTKLI